MDLKDLREKILKDPILFRLSNLAKEKNIPLCLVGGYIRDLLLETHRPAYPRLPDGQGQARMDYDFTLSR